MGPTDIILIESFPCDNKEQLHARERYYIELNNNICVNIHIPNRSKKEWTNVNKLTIAEKKKTYRQENAETLKEKKKIYNEQHKQEFRARIECFCNLLCWSSAPI